MAHLGDLVGWGCTINEPNIVAYMGYLVGVFPPGVHDVGRRRAVNDALLPRHTGWPSTRCEPAGETSPSG